jgi:hypothetical protein
MSAVALSVLTESTLVVQATTATGGNQKQQQQLITADSDFASCEVSACCNGLREGLGVQPVRSPKDSHHGNRPSPINAVSPNEPVIDKSVDYRAFCLQTTTKRKIKIFAQWDK